MEKFNYLRFMSLVEFELYCEDKLTECKTQWRADESPKFYFFGVESTSLGSIDLKESLDVGYYWIESSLNWSFDVGTNTHEIAVLFQGDGSLEREYASDYGDTYEDWENVVQFKTSNYNHLELLDARPCFLTDDGFGLGESIFEDLN